MTTKSERVAVIGASPKPERYSNQAVAMLLEYGHEVLPVHPAVDTIHDQPVFRHINDVEAPVDTVTLYVTSAISDQLTDSLLALRPGRIIFNPGTENPALQQKLEKHGISYEEACTLVLLRSNQF